MVVEFQDVETPHLVIDYPRVERLHAAWAEHSVLHGDIDAVLEHAEVRMLVATDVPVPAFRSAFERRVVENDAVVREFNLPLPNKFPVDVDLSIAAQNDDDVIVDR